MTRIITNQNIYTEMTPNEAKELITIISMLQWDYIRGDHEEHSNDDRYIIGGFFYCLIEGLLKVDKKIKINKDNHFSCFYDATDMIYGVDNFFELLDDIRAMNAIAMCNDCPLETAKRNLRVYDKLATSFKEYTLIMREGGETSSVKNSD